MNTFQPTPKRILFSEVRWQCVGRLYERNREKLPMSRRHRPDASIGA
jgi:hypothetical protein